MGLFSRDLKVGQGEKYDITKISKEEISQEEIAKNKKKLIEIFNFFNMNGGETLDNIELLKAMDYFGSLDTDGDNKISDKELEEGVKFLNEKLSLTDKDEIKAKDLKNFIKNVVNATKDNETSTADEMFTYDDTGEFEIQDITSSSDFVNEKGQKSTVIKYEYGREVTTNPDGSYSVKTSNESGAVTNRIYTADNKVKKESIQYSNNDSDVTDYDENGQPVKKISVHTDENGSKSTSEVIYKDGKETTAYVSNGNTVLEYSYVDGEALLTRKVEHKGTENQRISNYTFNSDDETVTEKISAGDTDITRKISADGTLLSERIENGLSIKEKVYNQDGTVEETDYRNTGIVKTIYNENGKRLSQTIDDTFSLEYDGNGNTKGVVVQFGESISDLADKFNCTVDEILQVNEGAYKGKGNKAYFTAGQEIVIPRELNVDDASVIHRDSKETAIQKYNNYMEKRKAAEEELAARNGHGLVYTNNTCDTWEQVAKEAFKREGNLHPSSYQMKLRINELKKLNNSRNLEDGNLKGKKITVTYSPEIDSQIGAGQIMRERAAKQAKATSEAAAGKSIANAMYKTMDEHAGGVGEKDFQDALNNVTKDNVVGVIEEYNKISPDETLIEAIMDETGSWSSTRKKAANDIIGKLIERASAAGVSEERLKQMADACNVELDSSWSNIIGYYQTQELDGFVNNIVGSIHAAEAMTREEKIKASDTDAISVTGQIMTDSVYENTAILENQLKKDGWCADLYEGLKWCVGSDNLDENVKADIAEFNSYISKLAEAEKTKGEDAFKAEFRKLFGVDFDPNLVHGYKKLESDYTTAVALTSGLEKFNRDFDYKGIDNSDGTHDYSGIYYDKLRNKLGGYIENAQGLDKGSGSRIIEQQVIERMQNDKKNFSQATEAEKNKYLIDIISDIRTGIENEIKNYTNGQSLDKMKNDLQYARTAVFGNKGDLANRVGNYVESQATGGAITGAAVKAVGAIVLTVATGGTAGGLVVASLGTAAISTTVDMSDRITSDVPMTDDEIKNILKNAAIDGGTVFLGGKLTQAASLLKSTNSFVQAGGQFTANVAGDAAIAAGAEYLQTGEITIEGVTFQAVFSAAGNLISLKQLAKAKADTPDGSAVHDLPDGKTPFERSTQGSVDHNGVAKERAVGKIGENKFNEMVEDVSARVRTMDDSQLEEYLQRARSLNNGHQRNTMETIVMDEQLLRHGIPEETNLGKLYELEQSISKRTNDPRKDELLEAIAKRRETLQTENSFVVESAEISREIKDRAISALNQTKRKLKPDQLGDINRYIETITNADELNAVVKNLQDRGMKLSSGTRLRSTIDKKYAELNVHKPESLSTNNVPETGQPPADGNSSVHTDADANGTPSNKPDEVSQNETHDVKKKDDEISSDETPEIVNTADGAVDDAVEDGFSTTEKFNKWTNTNTITKTDSNGNVISVTKEKYSVLTGGLESVTVKDADGNVLSVTKYDRDGRIKSVDVRKSDRTADNPSVVDDSNTPKADVDETPETVNTADDVVDDAVEDAAIPSSNDYQTTSSINPLKRIRTVTTRNSDGEIVSKTKYYYSITGRLKAERVTDADDEFLRSKEYFKDGSVRSKHYDTESDILTVELCDADGNLLKNEKHFPNRTRSTETIDPETGIKTVELRDNTSGNLLKKETDFPDGTKRTETIDPETGIRTIEERDADGNLTKP